MSSKKVLLVRMTNRGRTFVFQKATRTIANKLGLTVQKEIFLDTSEIDDLKEGETLLTNALQQISEQFSEYIIILIKDAKWSPKISQIKSNFAKNTFFAADIPYEIVERYAIKMDTDGFIKYTLNLIGITE